MKNSYPKVLFPDFFKQLSQLRIDMKEVYPDLSMPPKPTLPIRERVNVGQLIGCFILSFIIFLILAGLWVEEIFPNIDLRLLTLAFSFLTLAFFYWLSVVTSKKEYRYNMNLYEGSLLTYEIKIEEYCKKEKEIQRVSFQNAYKQKKLMSQIGNIYEQIIADWKILDDKEVKKGPSELFFYEFLKKGTDYDLYKSVKCSYYYPDLILVDKSSKLIFDIEIDEPYILGSKKPIHFDNSDKSRDEFFNRMGFVIIRFSEDQAVISPGICLDIINSVKVSLLLSGNLEGFERMNIANFVCPCWTFEDAFKMAYNNSRTDTLKKIDQSNGNKF